MLIFLAANEVSYNKSRRRHTGMVSILRILRILRIFRMLDFFLSNNTINSIHLFMFNINSMYQPEDPGDGGDDGNGKREPNCYDRTKSIKSKCKISELTVLTNLQSCFFAFT